MMALNKETANPKDLVGVKKPPLALIPASALLYMGQAMALGARKYGPYNWRDKPVRRTVYLDAALRHIVSDLDGEDRDTESGIYHLAHAMACMGIVLDSISLGILIDDRPKPGVASKLITELTER